MSIVDTTSLVAATREQFGSFHDNVWRASVSDGRTFIQTLDGQTKKESVCCTYLDCLMKDNAIACLRLSTRSRNFYVLVFDRLRVAAASSMAYCHP